MRTGDFVQKCISETQNNFYPNFLAAAVVPIVPYRHNGICQMDLYQLLKKILLGYGKNVYVDRRSLIRTCLSYFIFEILSRFKPIKMDSAMFFFRKKSAKKLFCAMNCYKSDYKNVNIHMFSLLPNENKSFVNIKILF